jgi:CRISP-associated protein Cas1
VTVLYVREQGAVVRRDGEQVRVTFEDKVARRRKVLQTLPIRELEQLAVYGNVQITTQAVALLLEHEVDVAFFSMYGRFRGRLGRGGSKHARLRHAQLGLSSSEGRSLTAAKTIVRAKLANQRALLLRLAEERPQNLAGELRRAAEGINQMREAAASATDPDQLRGYEGKGSVYYFGAFRRLLSPDWRFDGRKFYPPPDPFNALLSFGYALLQKDVTATIEIVGLDGYLGCFHTLEYGRPSLALDLMEEFRPLVVDTAMLDIVFGEKLKPQQFVFTGREDRPVELGQALLPVAIQGYEERLQDVVQHPGSGSGQTLRRCIELQARSYARFVMGSRRDYDALAL